MENERWPPIIAVDFDDTLSLNGSWPIPGNPNWDLINWLNEKQDNGALLILWTCREGDDLGIALNWCSNYGLHFDAVNENVPCVIKSWGNRDYRKVYADAYIDDKARTPYDFKEELV